MQGSYLWEKSRSPILNSYHQPTTSGGGQKDAVKHVSGSKLAKARSAPAGPKVVLLEYGCFAAWQLSSECSIE